VNKILCDQRLARQAGLPYAARLIGLRVKGFSMSFMLVSVAFLAFSAVQADQGAATQSGAGLATENRAQPEGTNNTEGTEANGERRICRRMTTSSTHQYRRVCMTARQWRQYNDENDD